MLALDIYMEHSKFILLHVAEEYRVFEISWLFK